MVRRFFLSVLMLTAVSYFAGLPLAQAARQQRILQPIIVNGQQERESRSSRMEWCRTPGAPIRNFEHGGEHQHGGGQGHGGGHMEAGNSTVDRVTDKLVQFGLLRCGWDSVNSSAFKLLF